ncbi:S8 family peptidase [Actinophytocola sp.]|uniref:S8 family peptidase n=1 Tax=Actinophytocola sp. TaxID=1872138 RepID=UPI002ED334F8
MRIRASACVLTVLASLVVSAAPATAAPPTEAAPAGRQVTLITGDVVTEDIGITPAPRERPVPFTRMTLDGDEYVIPGDAEPLVASGQLDRELFNVTGLLRQRYDDAHTDSTPLLVQQRAGLRAERTFDMLGLASVQAPKKGKDWRELTASGGKVWLNAKLSASLDVSVPQIGAPAAWEAGFTGEGVTVAVLDSGVDADHPDLAGKVATSKNFSASPDTDDRAGHGTHVASTIASGDTRYRGVAPGAKLAIGKVLDDDGYGQWDDIIAGMRWAAAEQKADVVNMSLGGNMESDGTDPVSQAVNELSAAYGTLFVVAAGNEGTRGKISMPAAADAALTVASTTKAGAVSEFSTRGPRPKDAAMKPEIAAPGSDIVAAQAGGTHVSMSGTSMASPHIAGAAAILAGQHPDWTGDQIKAALVSTAAPIGAGAYEVGSGRADLAHAVSSTVLVSPAAVSANLKWPNTKPRKDIVTYRNTGTSPVTLSLTLDLPGAPGGLATLSANTVTIAPGGQGSVTITTKPRSGQPGQYGGVLTATAADGRTSRTPVSVQDEVESYDLGVAVLDRDGKPVTDYGLALVDQATTERLFTAPGATYRLPRSKYTAWVSFAGADGEAIVLAHPVVDLKRNTTIRFDARQARRVSAQVDRPEVRAGIGQVLVSMQNPGEADRVGMVLPFDPQFTQVYAASTPGVTSPSFHFSNSYRLEEPYMEMFTETAPRVEIPIGWWDTQPSPGTRREHVVDGGRGTPDDLSGVDTTGKMVVIQVSKEDEDIDQRIANVAASGAASAVVSVQSSGKRHQRNGFPALYVPSDYVGRLLDVAKAGGEVTWTSREGGKERYELAFPADGKIPAEVAHSVRTADLAAVRTRYYGQTTDAPPRVGASYVTAYSSIGVGFHVPVRPSQERVEYFTPGTWNLNVGTAQDFRRQQVTLAAGSETRVSWNRAVLSPGFTGTTTSSLGENHPWAYRRQEIVDVTVPFFTDADGHAMAPELEETSSGTTSLYQSGKLLGTQHLAGKGTFWVGQNTHDYRFVTEVTRDAAWWPLSTKISAEWTFRSGFIQGPFNSPLPLLSVRAEPPVDITNRAPAGPVSVPVTVTRQDGPATINTVALEYSTDDGTTWRQAAVTRDGDRWLAQLDNPADGFVSLRTKATDTEGNTADVTVIRAYQVG